MNKRGIDGVAIGHICRGLCGGEQRAYQIIVVRFGDFTAVKVAGFGFLVFGEVIDKQLAVNFRGVHGRAAFPQQFGFF